MADGKMPMQRLPLSRTNSLKYKDIYLICKFNLLHEHRKEIKSDTVVCPTCKLIIFKIKTFTYIKSSMSQRINVKLINRLKLKRGKSSSNLSALINDTGPINSNSTETKTWHINWSKYTVTAICVVSTWNVCMYYTNFKCHVYDSRPLTLILLHKIWYCIYIISRHKKMFQQFHVMVSNVF